MSSRYFSKVRSGVRTSYLNLLETFSPFFMPFEHLWAHIGVSLEVQNTIRHLLEIDALGLFTPEAQVCEQIMDGFGTISCPSIPQVVEAIVLEPLHRANLNEERPVCDALHARRESCWGLLVEARDVLVGGLRLSCLLGGKAGSWLSALLLLVD